MREMLTINDNNSEKIIADQIPTLPSIDGTIKTVKIWNTSVLKNEMIPEVIPSFNAVNSDDEKILNPDNKYAKTYIWIPSRVIERVSLSYPTKKVARVFAKTSDKRVKHIDDTKIKITLFLNKFFNSSIFFAPKL